MKIRNDLRLLQRLWPYARQQRLLYMIALITIPLSLGLSLIQPLLVKEAVDGPMLTGDLPELMRISSLYLLAVAGGFVVQAGFTLSVAYAGQRTLADLRRSIYAHLMARPASFFDTRPAGVLLTRATSDVNALTETLQRGAIYIVLDVFMILGALGAMLALDWRLTLALLLLAPPVLFLLNFTRRRLRVLFDHIRDRLASLNAFLAERLAGVEVVQLFGLEDDAQDRFDGMSRDLLSTTLRSNAWDAFLFAAIDGISTLCVAGILGFGVSSWSGGALSAGLIVAFIDYLDRLFRPLREFSSKVSTIQRAVSAVEKIGALLDEQETLDEGSLSLASDAQAGIEFTDVRFRYREDLPWVLRGISWRVEPGQVVALVGPTGCGKTTITRLLSRVYGSYEGSITLDGVEVSGLQLSSVRERIASVHQDLHIFPDTLRFNVTMGREGVSQEALDRVAGQVYLDRLVEELPQGWDTPIRPSSVSVGQAQLITFARALLYEPQLVILDEATAAVDPLTESWIQRATDQLLADRTVVVVAHRLSTITAADCILVLDRGEIVERGRHEELLERGEVYARLYQEGFSS